MFFGNSLKIIVKDCFPFLGNFQGSHPSDNRKAVNGNLQTANPPLTPSRKYAMININNVPPVMQAGGKVAVHVHIFYLDLVKEFVGYLEQMPFPYDLFVFDFRGCGYWKISKGFFEPAIL